MCRAANAPVDVAVGEPIVQPVVDSMHPDSYKGNPPHLGGNRSFNVGACRRSETVAVGMANCVAQPAGTQVKGHLTMKTQYRNSFCEKLLDQYKDRIAMCRSGRYGRVTGVHIGDDGRPVYTGHHVDPGPTLVFAGEETSMWIDRYGIKWQSVKPKWIA